MAWHAGEIKPTSLNGRLSRFWQWGEVGWTGGPGARLWAAIAEPYHVLGSEDNARSLSRMHMKEIQTRIEKALDQKDVPIDDTTRAHLEESRDKIAKVLDASLQANSP